MGKKLFLTLAMVFFCLSSQAQNLENMGKPVDLTAYDRGFNHVGIPTSNLEKSLAFYEGLGFRLIFPTDRTQLNGLTFVKLGNTIIELIPKKDQATPMTAGAVDHFCIHISNIKEVYQKFKAAGYKFQKELTDLDYVFEKGETIFKIYGINNEIIEFCEIY